MAELNDLLKKVTKVTKITKVIHLQDGLTRIVGEGTKDNEMVRFDGVVDMANDDIERLVMPCMLGDAAPELVTITVLSFASKNSTLTRYAAEQSCSYCKELSP